ncbi:acyl carrier protein [Accumulibacter sp.]|uniref:acyl carrier protein n=1 Tax=Accumulibacter sp. TaxID=2053492 RepID=UPI0025EA395E|nr:acyl carrier protein [Accumulibacter sp.]MCM8614091.1 acyl carrier protein [Accumulibacter sp.]MCM8637885.1 acyl carrier protein [Accumulibacter sp.]MCM8641292.1 acyl carrier protein [Accumulibacter sp.]
MSDQEILDKLRTILHDAFEIEATRVTPETQLFADLDLDSIDAVDLAIQLQKLTGKRIQPQDFKDIRSVADVVAAVRRLMAA